MRTMMLLLFPVALAWSQTPRAVVPDGVQAFRDLTYVDGGHERHKLDLFLPKEAKGPLPLIIWVHGGGWQNGSKDGCPPLRNGYVQRGYAVASINYRLSGHAVFPAQIQDCKAAIRWLRAHADMYSLDPQRFGVWGSSAGGHLVALIGTSGDIKEFDVGAHLDHSSRVQAVCDWFGPTDFTVFVTTPGYERHASDTSPESKLLGGTVMENKDKAARLNPITYVSKDDPPFLIVHGDKDSTVPLNQSSLLFDSLKGSQVSAHFHTIHGAGHGGPGFAGDDISTLVATFFEERLKSGITRLDARTTNSTVSADQPSKGPRAAMPSAMQRRTLPSGAMADRFDRDKDGNVSRDEFKGPPGVFQRLDRNGDGKLDRAEQDAVSSPRPPAPSSPSPTPKTGATSQGFKLDGEQWTYADGEFAMDGILLKPEGPGPFPAVLISHGLGGNARSFGLSKAREMVQWGLVCIAPNYAHSTVDGDRAQFGASAENIRRASTCLEILRGMPAVDGTRIAGYGHSMGGFVTIGLAATSSTALQAAAITASGISAQEGYAAPTAKMAASIRTPFLMLHGGKDNTVRPEQSAALKQVLDQNQVPNDRLVADDQGHPIDQTMREDVFRLVRDWFKGYGVLPK